ncbi:MAG: hypothetical protein AVDCRST_MAG05-5190, partial [uncultured Rubrobacteraceae bacterium]
GTAASEATPFCGHGQSPPGPRRRAGPGRRRSDCAAGVRPQARRRRGDAVGGRGGTSCRPFFFPAQPCHAARGTGARGGRDRGPPGGFVGAVAHVDRGRRRWEDPPRRRGRAGGAGISRRFGRGCVRRARVRGRPRAHLADHRQGPGAKGAEPTEPARGPAGAPAGPAPAPRARQPRAPSRGGPRAGVARRGLPRTHRAGDQPGAPAHQGGARVPRASRGVAPHHQKPDGRSGPADTIRKALPGARPGRLSRVRDHRGERRRRGAGLLAARRDTPGAGAGGGEGEVHGARGAPHPPGPGALDGL